MNANHVDVMTKASKVVFTYIINFIETAFAAVVVANLSVNRHMF